MPTCKTKEKEIICEDSKGEVFKKKPKMAKYLEKVAKLMKFWPKWQRIEGKHLQSRKSPIIGFVELQGDDKRMK